MYPHNNYGFNPAMILDPITMSPMIRGGSITVNPLGVPVRAEQKPWQKMFMKNIPEDMPNQLLQKILKVIGNLRSFKRSQKQKGKLLPFCHFQYDSGEEVLRAQKFLNNIKILDRVLELKTSEQTQSFIKQWMTIQKQQWKKKLMATGMNEAKQYESLEKYLDRDDKIIAQKLANVIATVNGQYKRVIQQKMRDDQRKQHPKQKQRDKRKKQFREDLQRKHNQKLQYWLKREKQSQRQYKKQKDKQRQRQKAKLRKLERQMDLDTDEQNRKIAKFLNPQRKKFRQKQLANDNQKIQLQWNPPQPVLLLQPNAPEDPAPQDMDIEDAPKTRVFTLMQQQLVTSNHQKVDHGNHLLVIEPLKNNSVQSKPKPNSMFYVEQQQPETQKKIVSLNLPPINVIEQLHKQQEQAQMKQQQKKKKTRLIIQASSSKQIGIMELLN